MAAKKTYAVGDVVTLQAQVDVTVHTPDDMVLKLRPTSGRVSFVAHVAGEFIIAGLANERTITAV